MIAMQEIDNIVAEVMSRVLGRPVSPDDNLAMTACEAWDSLKHIELIVMMEERFDICFDAASLPELTSQDTFVEHIRKLIGNA